MALLSGSYLVAGWGIYGPSTAIGFGAGQAGELLALAATALAAVGYGAWGALLLAVTRQVACGRKWNVRRALVATALMGPGFVWLSLALLLRQGVLVGFASRLSADWPFGLALGAMQWLPLALGFVP